MYLSFMIKSCMTLWVATLAHLWAVENLGLQLLDLIDLGVDLVGQVSGLLHLLEELLHVA